MAMKDDEIPVSTNIDEPTAERLIRWIVSAEAENNKTNKRDDSEMIRYIAKHIQEEVRCL